LKKFTPQKLKKDIRKDGIIPKKIVKIVTKKRISNEFLIYLNKILPSEKPLRKNVLRSDVIIEKSGVIAMVDIAKTNKNINQFSLEL
tara:strand:+ start:89 stop:349 length:261 start_codon:yes stop_codon:yes gene_type:complete